MPKRLLYYNASTRSRKPGKYIPMFFQINPSNGVPVYEQVVRQVTFAVANGSMRQGDLLPSVRQLARDLAINPNTVARAYRELQDQDVIESIRGTGMSISEGARSICRSERTRILRHRLALVIDEARQSQLDDAEIEKLFRSELGKKNSKKRGN